MAVRFFRTCLRTTDVDAARAFYGAVLGGAAADVVQLHEHAIARGARPHWLGFLDVGDVDAAARAFVARGAVPLGAKWIDPEGLEAAVLRDPGGAVVALAKPPASATATAPRLEPVWYELNTADADRAKANYGELFGWGFGPPVDVGARGVLHPFAWERGGPAVGSMRDVSAHPEVHSHWLFHFRVAALEPAMDAVLAAGGTVAVSSTTPEGERFAVCDDPQGAAFAMRARL